MRKTSLTGPFAELATIAGGVSALAKALGVSEMTLWRWNNGVSQPSGPALARLRRFAAAHGDESAERVTCALLQRKSARTNRPPVGILLSEKALVRLAKLASRDTVNRSEMVEKLILQTPLRRS